ncbi:GntR family transcriptional regulator [Pseudarthrobacter sp. PS3-L1]|uniref:GntR family transcriptional regulator n=1 Tax=Pseudarthrobacter sp. PS3-L1 TaxID=3046207 RepID=UPI0024BB0247|nr:GntR family transcriptional regulator [Pseudarthrobacter sp. PS3-L1]MDJ0320232.1 GntR family transcriptional regulator [Pseudarthrobacter sp. PS3-L1]
MSGAFPGSWRPQPNSSVPLFDQLRVQILARADDGSLAPGTRLPAVRALAENLGVAPHTVARAYKELESAGVVRTQGRNGTVVSARESRISAASVAAAQLAVTAKATGVSFAEAVQLLAAAYDAEQ